MPLFEEKFDQHKIDTLRQYLKRESDKQRPKDYEIIIDGFPVVSRTNDINEFEDYEGQITSATRNISILIFDGLGTNRNKRYSFTLRGEPAGAVRNSNGLGDIDQLIEDRIATKDREHELSRLTEKLQAIEGQLSEAEEYTGQLEQKIRDLENGQLQRQVGIGEFAGFVLSGLLKQNPQLLRSLPGGEALAGLLGTMPVTEPSHATETNASFEKSPAIDEHTRNRLSLIQQMQQQFNEQQMVGVFSIIEELTAAPDLILSVLHFLHPEKQAA